MLQSYFTTLGYMEDLSCLSPHSHKARTVKKTPPYILYFKIT